MFSLNSNPYLGQRGYNKNNDLKKKKRPFCLEQEIQDFWGSNYSCVFQKFHDPNIQLEAK